MPVSQAKLDANRQNAKKSTGPTSERAWKGAARASTPSRTAK